MASGLCFSSPTSAASSVLVRAPAATATASTPSSVFFSQRISAAGRLRSAPVSGPPPRPLSERQSKFLSRADAQAADTGVAEASPPTPPTPPAPAPAPKKKVKVSPNPMRNQRVLLKFLWLEKNIGISLDQVVPGHGTIPLCPYFFWPRKDAWEELKAKLDSKKWISRKRTIILLNQATDIINLWQQNATSSL